MFLKTLTIFDWDDTLYPTISFMMNNGINYNDLDHKIYSLLSVISYLLSKRGLPI